MLTLFGRLGQLVCHIFSHVFSQSYFFPFRFKNTIEMPNYRYRVRGCNNDSRYLDKIVKRSHVKEVKFHHFPKDESKRQLWKEQVDKGLDRFIVSNTEIVCSNHSECRKPIYASPLQTMFINVRKTLEPSLKKLRTLVYKNLHLIIIKIKIVLSL